MKKTVKEIIEMIDKKILNYDQSTQRNFIYVTMPQIKTEDGDITRAGNVIRSIIQFDIQLPALYFWDLGNGKYNIHDGKQRILSIYYFVNPINNVNVVTRINGRERTFTGLSKSDQNKLLDYTFDIVVKSGSPEKEEKSFYLINTNSVPLTDYESLRGIFHGPWIYQFEKYLEEKSSVLDRVKKIGRGDQAILFLYNCFDLLGDRIGLNRIQVNLRDVRNNSFEASSFRMDEIVELYSEFSKITSVNDERAIQVASYIVKTGWDRTMILNYYREIVKLPNDLKSWKYETHLVAINRLIQDGIKCDGKRFFSDDDKSLVYREKQLCSHPTCGETNYKDLEKDHLIAWSRGGKTNIENLQVLCKTHNASKGADDDGQKG
jgi:5-methylcytosine-specific restriction endonuclease McrA